MIPYFLNQSDSRILQFRIAVRQRINARLSILKRETGEEERNVIATQLAEKGREHSTTLIRTEWSNSCRNVVRSLNRNRRVIAGTSARSAVMSVQCRTKIRNNPLTTRCFARMNPLPIPRSKIGTILFQFSSLFDRSFVFIAPHHFIRRRESNERASGRSSCLLWTSSCIIRFLPLEIKTYSTKGNRDVGYIPRL